MFPEYYTVCIPLQNFMFIATVNFQEKGVNKEDNF